MRGGLWTQVVSVLNIYLITEMKELSLWFSLPESFAEISVHVASKHTEQDILNSIFIWRYISVKTCADSLQNIPDDISALMKSAIGIFWHVKNVYAKLTFSRVLQAMIFSPKGMYDHKVFFVSLPRISLENISAYLISFDVRSKASFLQLHN